VKRAWAWDIKDFETKPVVEGRGACHCEESQTTKQSQEKTRLLSSARNDSVAIRDRQRVLFPNPKTVPLPSSGRRERRLSSNRQTM